VLTRLMRLIVVVVAIAGLTAAVPGQDADPIFLEALWPAHQQLGGDLTRMSADGVAGPDPHHYELEFEPFDSFALTRNFTRQAVQHDALPLAVAINETTSSTLDWDPFAGTHLNFATSSTTITDFQEMLISSTEVSTMGFQQELGSGSSATTFGFTRKVTSRRAGLTREEKLTQWQYTLASELADDWDLSMKLCDSEANKPGGYWNRDFSGSLAVPLSGGTGSLGFTASRTLADGSEGKTQRVDMVAPFSVSGGQAVAEHHTSHNSSASEKHTRLTRFFSPLKLMGESGSLEHKIEEKLKASTLTEKKTTVLCMPFRISGRTIGHKETLISEDIDGVGTDTFETELRVPISGGNAILQRQVKTKPDGEDGEWEQRRMVVKTPSFRIGNIGQFKASRTTTDTVGEDSLRVTDFALDMHPCDPLEMAAKWQLTDASPEMAVKSRNLNTSWDFSRDLALKYHFSEQEVPDKSPTVLRHLELERTPKKAAGVGVSVGYVGRGVDGETIPSAALVKVGVGKEGDLRLDAKYSEFDDRKKLDRYDEHPFVEFILRHSSDKDRSVQFRYQDQQGRADAERAIRLAFGALGGNMQLGYGQNSLGPDGKNVRRADVYDAVLDREILGGDVNLKLGVRYCDYIEEELVEHHYDMRLSGGREDRGGKVALSYLSGEFVSGPKGSDSLPRSVFKLSYSRQWGVRGRLSLTVDRETAPHGMPTEEGNVTGQLRYQMGF